MTTTDLQNPDIGQTLKEFDGVYYVCVLLTLTLIWDSGVTAQHKNNLLK